jgi:hypothetical protein
MLEIRRGENESHDQPQAVPVDHPDGLDITEIDERATGRGFRIPNPRSILPNNRAIPIFAL